MLPFVDTDEGIAAGERSECFNPRYPVGPAPVASNALRQSSTC
jgi:hypothetical protein